MSCCSKYQDLSALVDKDKTWCLNADSGHPVLNLFTESSDYCLKSLDDEQLLIFMPFKGTVKLWSLNITAPTTDERPVLVKLYINQVSMNFQDVDDIKPTQVIELTESDMAKDRHNLLKFTSFQRVDSITIFIEDNDGADISTISSISFTGEPVDGMNIKDWKPIKG